MFYNAALHPVPQTNIPKFRRQEHDGTYCHTKTDEQIQPCHICCNEVINLSNGCYHGFRHQHNRNDDNCQNKKAAAMRALFACWNIFTSSWITKISLYIQYTVYFIPYSVYIIFFGNSVNSPYFSFVPPSFYPEKHCHCSPAILNTYAKTIHLFFHCCNTKVYIHQKIFCLLMIKKRVCLFRHTRFVYHLISVWKSSSEARYGWIPDDLL